MSTTLYAQPYDVSAIGFYFADAEEYAAKASVEEAPVLFHPSMAQRYHQQVRDLIAALNEYSHRSEAAELIRGLIEKVVLVPNTDGKGLDVDLHGDLAGIIAMSTGHHDGQSKTSGKPSSEPDLSDDEIQQVKLVAGVGFEPTTFRL